MSDTSMEARVLFLEEDMRQVRLGHKRLSDAVDDMRAVVDHSNVMTQDIKEIVESVKGFFTVISWMGKGLKFAALPLVGVAALFYAIFHHGQMPTWWKLFVAFFLE